MKVQMGSTPDTHVRLVVAKDPVVEEVTIPVDSDELIEEIEEIEDEIDGIDDDEIEIEEVVEEVVEPPKTKGRGKK